MPEIVVRPDGSVGANIIDADARIVPHWARVNAFNPGTKRPLNVTRNWHGHQVFMDCYISQSVKDAYLAEELAVNDFVLVVFVDGDVEKPLAVEKVVETW